MAIYKAEKISTGKWSVRVATANSAHLDRFVAALDGEREVGSVTRDEVRAWRGGLKLKQGTVRYRVQMVSTFFGWCVEEGYVEKNVARGLTPEEPSKRTGDTRRAYTSEEIKLLFGAEFTAKRESRADYFWISLLALYSGASVSELAQLATEDVVLRNGVRCLEIRARREEQSLKNEARERTIPIHSHLLGRLGFEKYVKQRKAAGETWLFPHCEPPNAGRARGARVTGWWSKIWEKKFLGPSANTAFHSLRHGAAQALIAADVPEVVAKQILGHSDVSMTTGVYGKRLGVRQLAKAIETLDFSAEVHALQSLTLR